MSTIEWTDETWNPTVGCSRVSPGCDHCYAIKVAARQMQPAHEGLTEMRTRLDWTGEVRMLPDRLDTPLHWRKPRRVFVDSMSDLFHPDVPIDFLRQVFQTMAQAKQHTFQVLTKRPQRMPGVMDALFGEYARKFDDCPTEAMRNSPAAQWARGRARSGIPNVWLGTSVENQRYADLRIPHLLATPAAVRFLSIEPLLGPVDLSTWLRPSYFCTKCGWGGSQPRMLGQQKACPFCPYMVLEAPPSIGWVIVGGESGPGARPMHPDWVRSLRDQCVAAGVPFFFKQWGEWLPLSMRYDLDLPERQREWRRYDTGESVAMEQLSHPTEGDRAAVRVGKKVAGRELDCRTWDEFPA